MIMSMNMVRVVLVLALAFAGRALRGEAAQPGERPPNIVLIIADDMAYTDYGFMGHPSIRTPRLDRLARESRVFPHGHVTTALCSPSLASILTGLYPRQHGVTGNDPPLPPGVSASQAERDPRFLAARERMIAHFDRAPTLPRILAGIGYESFQAGKWWGGSYRRGGFTQGMTTGERSHGGRHGDLGLAIGREGLDPIYHFIDNCISRKKPFFVWYAPMMPHSPHTPPQRLLDLYRDHAPSLEIAKYWAMCTWFDETCGQLLDFLDTRKLAPNTIVVFLADNGWIQDPKADRYAPRSKQSPYEGGLRTPILLRQPGQIAPATLETPVSELDIAPTLLKRLGVRPDSRMSGIDLLDDAAVKGRQAIFGELFTHNVVNLDDPLASLRFRWAIAGDWKLIVPNPPNEKSMPELFNLKEDPQESTNQFTARSDLARSLGLKLDHALPPR